ncbi:MAG: translocation/assembly module TamB, partial [Chlamydiae bacterium]|nr:translocation/assembly module TamB [Chlamydiota bacterium]
EQKAKEQGIFLHIGHIQGLPPLTWKIDELYIGLKNGSDFTLEKVSLRIGLIPLLQNKLSISYLHAEGASYTFSDKEISVQSITDRRDFSLDIPKLPFSFAIKNLQVESVTVNNTANQERISFSLRGNAAVKKDLKDISLGLELRGLDPLTSYAKVYLEGRERKNYFQADIELHIPSLTLTGAPFPLTRNSSFDLNASLKGSWLTWNSLVLQEPLSQDPLKVILSTKVSHIDVTRLPILSGPWTADGSFLLYPDLSLSCESITTTSPSVEALSSFSLDKDHNITSLSSAFTLKDLSLLPGKQALAIKGSAEGTLTWSPSNTLASIKSTDLQINNIHDFKAQLECHLEKTEDWQGCLTGSLSREDLQIEVSCDISKQEDILILRNLLASAGGATLDGDLSYHTQEKVLDGDLFIHATTLRPLRSIFPENSNLGGSMGGEIHFISHLAKGKDNLLPELRAHILMKNVRYFDKLIGQGLLDLKMQNITTNPEGNLSMDCENVLFKNIYFSKVQIATSQNGAEHPFQIMARGIWKEDLELTATGFWQKKNDLWMAEVNSLFGKILQKPFSIESPFSIKMQKNTFCLENALIDIADGRLALEIDLSPTKAKISAKAKHLPLDVLTIANPGIDLLGRVSFDAELDSSLKKKSGYLNLSLEQAELKEIGKETKVKAKGSLQAHLEGDKVQIFSHVYASDEQFIDLTATLPIDLRMAPFHIALNPHRKVSAELIAEGSLEAIFDFINIGSHKPRGLLTAHLYLSSTLNNPSLKGLLELQNGSYENYVIGTRLKNINAELIAANKELILKKFSSSGKEGGTLDAIGKLYLSPKDKFPFTTSGALKELKLLDFEMISSEFTGDLEVIGNTDSAIIKGDVTLPKATINIGETLPMQVPELDITYINRPIHLEGASLKSSTSYPLNYDVNITAADTVFVKGKGLNSEWKGRIHLTGKNAQVASQGRLTLLKGDFMFSGKQFSLTQGEITFNDKTSPGAYIKINGALQMSDVQVLAVMQGPLSAPTLTFQSIPHMPTSSILARILFNKDISEITAVQALQLASVIVSMSGNGGPDVLEAIRKSIGVDRLNIVGKDGSDEISLQIGWYLTHGVTVSLSQSATSSDVTVEVDLKHGFIFQAETQNQEEGKFSLKWNRNY